MNILLNNKNMDKGFTLIELLIVIAIIAIIAAVVFVALDPLTRFQDSRDSVRWQDTRALAEAIKIDQVDNGGNYLQYIEDLSNDVVYMIVDGTAPASGCDDQNTFCDTNVNGDTSCINLAGLVTEGYLSGIPISPNGEGTWTKSVTGYTLEKKSTGVITVRSCESENSDEIWISK